MDTKSEAQNDVKDEIRANGSSYQEQLVAFLIEIRFFKLEKVKNTEASQKKTYIFSLFRGLNLLYI